MSNINTYACIVLRNVKQYSLLVDEEILMGRMISKNWLKKCGVIAEEAELKKLAKIAYDEWELRIGQAIADHLSQKQLDEFAKITDGDKSLAWLERAFPGYSKTVVEQKSKLAQEIKLTKDKVGLIKSWQDKDD